jgi:hypothetical protein
MFKIESAALENGSPEEAELFFLEVGALCGREWKEGRRTHREGFGRLHWVEIKINRSNE